MTINAESSSPVLPPVDKSTIPHLEQLEAASLKDKETCNIDNAPEEHTPHSTTPSFLEGGTRAWLSMIGASLVMFVTYGMASAFGVFQDYYTEHLLSNHSPSDISWIGSLQTCLLYGMGFLTGFLFDRGYFFQLVAPGSVMYLLSIFMLSLCKPGQYYQFFLTQGVGMGLGMGLMSIPCVSMISHHFHARRATANGLVFAGTSIGGIIWPLILNRLLQKGFEEGIRNAGFICLGLLLPANLLMRTRFSELPKHNTPTKGVAKAVFTDWIFSLALLSVFIIGLGLLFPVVYLQPFASLHGVPKNITDNLLTVLYASSIIFGRIIPGVLADRFGPLNVMTLYTLIGGAIIPVMSRAHSGVGTILFAVFYGPCSAACQSLFPAIVSSYTNNLFEFGFRLGLGGLTYGLGSLVGTPVTGVLLRPPRYDWNASIIFSAITVLVGSLGLLLSRQLLASRRGVGRV